MMKQNDMAKRFIWSAIVQGALLSVVTFVLFVYGSIYLSPSPALVIASGGAGTWLLVGYIVYILMIIGLGTTAFLYDFVENSMKAKFDDLSNLLGTIQLVFMNVGMIGSTWLLMYAGFAGGVALLPSQIGGGGLSQSQAHYQILGTYPVPIIVFMLITMLGMFAGGVVLLKALRSRKS